MKILILPFLLLSFVSCITSSKKSAPNLTTLEKLGLGISEDQAISALGLPASRTDRGDDSYSLNFIHPEDGYQRLVLYFSTNEKKLMGYLWLPRAGEDEHNFERAKQRYKVVNFELINEDSTAHHISPVYSLIDKGNGITLRFNRERNTVEAIARFAPVQRQPSDTE